MSPQIKDPIPQPMLIVVSKDEVTNMDTEGVIGVLQSLRESPEKAREHQERIDLSFDGYNDDTRELFEIDQVREFVQLLDEHFPYWLFFMSKYYTGLHCIALCHMPPFLTDEARARIHPKQLKEWLVKRWIPAMNEIAAFVGMSKGDRDQILERSLTYLTHGRLPLPDLGKQ